ncbi:MAG: pyroglutamyl-peptidase I [Hyphomicrobiaceae bacterium]|nr:pyroglutamyl-peptidase I [Hyphomicrobiaceae bacterium]
MPQDRPTVLLTGFGPFPSVAANATSILVPRLAEAARRALPGIRFAMYILPTEWETSLDLLGDLNRIYRPSIALHFGVSSRASGFEIETRGRNLCAQSADAAGCLPRQSRLSPRGPEYLPATLPSAHIVVRLRQKGLPAQISRDAGGYLCNALLYRSLELARASGMPTRTGFVHLPSSLVSERLPGCEPARTARLGWDDVIEGGLEIIAGALGRPPSSLASFRRGSATRVARPSIS